MKRLLVALVASAAACSGSDQSLGESRPMPEPIIETDPPSAGPSSGGSAGAPSSTAGSSGSGSSSGASPNPMPTLPACEDRSKHDKVGYCELPGAFCGKAITATGYECPGDMICCESGAMCPPPPFPCGDGDPGMSIGGAGGEPSAGAGGS